MAGCHLAGQAFRRPQPRRRAKAGSWICRSRAFTSASDKLAMMALVIFLASSIGTVAKISAITRTRLFIAPHRLISPYSKRRPIALTMRQCKQFLRPNLIKVEAKQRAVSKGRTTTTTPIAIDHPMGESILAVLLLQPDRLP